MKVGWIACVGVLAFPALASAGPTASTQPVLSQFAPCAPAFRQSGEHGSLKSTPWSWTCTAGPDGCRPAPAGNGPDGHPWTVTLKDPKATIVKPNVVEFSYICHYDDTGTAK